MFKPFRPPFSFTIPKFKLPALLATLGRKLPQWPHTLVLCTGLNAACKMRLLPEDDLKRLEGKTFLLDVLDTGSCAAFTYRNELFRPLYTPVATPDLAFRANLSAFLQLAARQEDPDSLFFSRELSIEGDTELGLIVKNMLDAVEWPKLPQIPVFRH